MAREDIGELAHHCGEVAAVRRDRNGRLYLNCPHCGLLKYNAPGGQDYILSNAVMYGPEGKPSKPAKPAAPEAPAPYVTEKAPPPAAAPAPAAAVTKPQPAPKRASWGTVL